MEINDYQRMALETAIYPENQRIIYPTLGLTGEAGEVSDKVKKVLRDNNGEFAPEKLARTWSGQQKSGNKKWEPARTTKPIPTYTIMPQK